MDWRKRMIMVDDGVNCYFNVIVDLNSKEYSQFHENGR